MTTNDMSPKVYYALMDSLLPAEREGVGMISGWNSGLEAAARICSKAEDFDHAEIVENILKLRIPDPLLGVVLGEKQVAGRN